MDSIAPGLIALIAGATIAAGLVIGGALALRANVDRRKIPPVSPAAFQHAADLIRSSERIEMIARRLDEVDLRLHRIERRSYPPDDVPPAQAPVSRRLRESGGWEAPTDPRITTAPRKKIDP